mmetsp:Transcript_136851/g.249535  ORF Transcript_136851/g.249535 Transcript_136851/m.249535 type:complete len:374 (-) Transcript_136851:2471-3592(-)
MMVMLSLFRALDMMVWFKPMAMMAMMAMMTMMTMVTMVAVVAMMILCSIRGRSAVSSTGRFGHLSAFRGASATVSRRGVVAAVVFCRCGITRSVLFSSPVRLIKPSKHGHRLNRTCRFSVTIRQSRFRRRLVDDFEVQVPTLIPLRDLEHLPPKVSILGPDRTPLRLHSSDRFPDAFSGRDRARQTWHLTFRLRCPGARLGPILGSCRWRCIQQSAGSLAASRLRFPLWLLGGLANTIQHRRLPQLRLHRRIRFRSDNERGETLLSLTLNVLVGTIVHQVDQLILDSVPHCDACIPCNDPALFVLNDILHALQNKRRVVRDWICLAINTAYQILHTPKFHELELSINNRHADVAEHNCYRGTHSANWGIKAIQ